MGLVAKDTGGGGDFTPAPQGTHFAICNMVVDLGHQKTEYMGQPKVKHQCYVRWELPHERIEYTDKDGHPHEGPVAIGKFYTVSLSEKANLRKDLEAWRGRAFTEDELNGFDLFNLAGVPCQVTITHKVTNDRTYANVTGVAGWPKGMDKPIPENPIIKYAEDDAGQWDQLPEWLQKKIKEAVPADYAVNQSGDPGANGQGDYYDPAMQGPPDLDSEIPF